MVLMSSHAVRTPDGRLLGHVQGGVMANHNLPFIDHINEIVYSEPFFGSEGTASIFLGDVRISTNVRLFGGAGERAIGTRVSQEVRDAVLGRGQIWFDRAFVVNDWYVSAYRPLDNGAGERVGMLYVGYLDRPFVVLKRAALATIGVLFLAVMTFAAIVSLRWAAALFRPLEQMARTMAQAETGVSNARVGTVTSTDEIGQLAAHLDRMLDRIADDTRALQRWNTELDAKVAERTRELESAKNHLVRSEKMAAIGLLTASVAHEINNPIAVIQGNLDLVRELLGTEAAAAVRSELRLIDEQIERMRLIVMQLLQFAKPNEYAGYVESVVPAQVVDEGLILVSPLLQQVAIRVERDFASTRSASINRRELQQVVVNLLANAIQAMPQGGTLAVGTQDLESGGVGITVSDTGPGLAQDVVHTLFQPFETHKKDGTGLGLWISRSIVERYGGDIQARNRTDGVSGACFVVLLQAER
jgi:C4-dicarboxylate-specific signal transduction histidine kinase